jgi:hypothetical protein
LSAADRDDPRKHVLLNGWFTGALVAPVDGWPSWSFRADVFRLAKAPAKSDRITGLFRRIRPFLLHKI